MMEIKDGGPAFPVKGGMCFMAPPGTEEQYEAMAKDVKSEYEGMTLRDWFAGMAITALDVAFYPSYKGMAEAVYGIADAMIAERDREAE